MRTVLELRLAGAGDVDVLQTAVTDNRVVLTHDGDFGRLAIADGEPFVGVVLLGPGHIDPVFTIRTLECLVAAELDVSPPFVIVARRRGNRVLIRLRLGSKES